MLRFITTLGVLAALIVPSAAEAHTPYLSIGTARLFRHKIEKKLERKLPHWSFVEAYPDGPPCKRISRTRINCGITGRYTDRDGITEQIVYTVHVRNYANGDTWARATHTGPTEVS